MSPADIPPMTPDLWIRNLLEAASMIADKETQERRWLATDRYAWECPDELINVLFDDCNFDLFIEEFSPKFTPIQRDAVLRLKTEVDQYCDATPGILDSVQALADPRWEAIRESARVFIAAFENKWPLHEETDSSA